MRIKQSICYPLFKPDEMSLEGLFALASKIGYKAAELWKRGDDFEDVAALAKRHGLIIASMMGHMSLEDGLRRVAPYAEKKNVNLNLELLNSKVDHPGYQCDHTKWGAAVCEKVGSPRVKLLYDIYHMQIMEGDIIRTIRENIRWIGHFHTAGNPGRNDMDDTQELNYAGICRAIAETDYGYYVGHEFKPKRNPVKALHHAFSVCDQGV